MSYRFEPDELRELEQRLSERLESIALRPGGTAADRVRTAIAATVQRTGLVPWLRARAPELAWPRVLAVSVTAAVALAIGIGIGRSGVLTSIHPSANPTAAATKLTPAPSESVLPRVAGIYQIWERSNLPQPAGQAPGVPHDIVAFRGGLLVVGGAKTAACAGAPCISETTSAVWRLEGGGWQRLPDQAGLRAGAMTSAAATSDHLLVLGETTFSPKGTGEGLLWPELWTSTDGVTFTARDAPAQFTAIAALSSGLTQFLAAAETDAGPEIWSSSDGVAWQKDVDAKALGGGWIQRIKSVAGQIVAVGSQTVESGPNGAVGYQGVIWTSFAGQTWTRMASDTLTNSQINDVAALGSRMVAVGTTGDLGFGLIWVSDDAGATWRRVDGAQVSTPIGAIQTTSHGLISVAGRSGSGLWVTSTGEAWDAVPQQAALSGEAGMGGIAVDPSTEDVYVVGSLGVGNQQRPVVWRSAGPRPSSAPSASPSALTVYTSIERASIPDASPQTFGGEAPQDVVAFKGGFVAVGGVVGTCCAGGYSPDTRATVWHSGDGRSWELLPPQSAFDHGQMLSVAANQNLIVAVGFRSLPPTTPGADEISPGTWWSSDGRNWHLAQGSPRFYSVTERAGTFLAVTIGNEIWRSSDGQNWTRAATTADLDHSTLRGITSGEFGIIAWGSQSNGAGGETTVIWRSADGTTWTRTSGAFGDTDIHVVTGRDRPVGLLAFGQRADKHWTIWTSADGLRWSESAAPVGGDGALLLAASTSRGFLLEGLTRTRLHLWASSTGSSWSEIAVGSAAMLPPAHTESEEMVAFAESSDGSIIAIGRMSKAGMNGISAAWVISP